MNIGIFCGRLGKDADLNRMQSGDAVCNFSVAVDVGTRDVPKTLWVECALFGKRGEALHQYLTKGIKVTVSGRVTLEQYANRDGQQKSAMRLNISEIDMHLPPREGQAQGSANRSADSANRSASTVNDDDMPF